MTTGEPGSYRIACVVIKRVPATVVAAYRAGIGMASSVLYVL
jgi:hypothetical protein